MHDMTHDPTLDWEWCAVCASALSRSFTKLADLDLGPKDAGVLVDRIKELAR